MKPNKSTCGIRFDAEDEAYVKDVSVLSSNLNDNKLKVGERTHAYLEQKGGTRYGDKTLKSVSQHPDFRMSVREVSRCLGLYLLVQRCGAEFTKRFPMLCTSALYELARFVREGLTDDEQRRW